jgi:osmotically-inducible protein OsmY
MESIKSTNVRNYLTIGVLSTLLLSSCAPVVIGGGAAAGYTLSQERNVGEIADDLAIKNHIKSNFAKKSMFTLVGVKVSEGRVLLTGKVTTQLSRLDAARIAWQQPGVREVNNDIIVTNNSEKLASHVATDSRITAEIKSKLLVTKNVNSTNYGFETIDGVVYVLGIAQNSRELDKVISVASKVKGVIKVVNHVRIKKY